MINSGIVQSYSALLIEKLQQENEQLQTKLAESEARVTRLTNLIKDLSGNVFIYDNNLMHTKIDKVLNETPRQSLQHIQAEAAKDFMTALVDSIPDERKIYPYEIQNFWIKYSNEQQTNRSDGDE